MEKRIVVKSFHMKNGLDDDHTLYEDGEILHEYDNSHYPNGYNLKRTLTSDDLKPEVKKRLLDAAPDENKDLVRQLLGL